MGCHSKKARKPRLTEKRARGLRYAISSANGNLEDNGLSMPKGKYDDALSAIEFLIDLHRWYSKTHPKYEAERVRLDNLDRPWGST